MSAGHRVAANAVWKRALIAMGGSVALHGALYAYLLSAATTPDLGFELELPSEVEFGLAESTQIDTAGASVSTTQANQPATPSATASQRSTRGEASDAGPLDAGPEDARVNDARIADAATRDGGVADGARPADARGQAEADAGAGALRRDSGAPHGPTDDIASTEGNGRLPPGAQLAIRMHFGRIRTSPLASDFNRLLRAIPDWQALLDGSGVDPVQDIERLLIASPNLERSKLVLAGRYEGNPRIIEETVARMAQARGVNASWRRTREGIPVAPWPNLDETERLIAHVGPRDFIISRPVDLPRVLAVARERGRRHDHPNEASETGPAALLSMGPGEAFSFEVEGAQRFVRGSMRGIPSRLRVAISILPNQHVAFGGTFFYENEEEAEAGLAFWDQARDRYARNTLIRLSGLGGVLQNTDLEREGAGVRFEATLAPAQVRLLIGYLEGILAPRAPRTPAGPTAPAASPTSDPRPP